MNIRITPATKSDWKIVQTLNHELFEDNFQYDRHLNLDWPFSPEGVKHYKIAVSAKNHCAFIARDGDVPVGHIVGGPKHISYRKLKTAEILEMGVSSPYQSKGIGKKLVEEVRKWAKAHGYKTLMVSAYFANERAIEFYKNQGLYPMDMVLEMDLK